MNINHVSNTNQKFSGWLPGKANQLYWYCKYNAIPYSNTLRSLAEKIEKNSPRHFIDFEYGVNKSFQISASTNKNKPNENVIIVESGFFLRSLKSGLKRMNKLLIKDAERRAGIPPTSKIKVKLSKLISYLKSTNTQITKKEPKAITPEDIYKMPICVVTPPKHEIIIPKGKPVIYDDCTKVELQKGEPPVSLKLKAVSINGSTLKQ